MPLKTKLTVKHNTKNIKGVTQIKRSIANNNISEEEA